MLITGVVASGISTSVHMAVSETGTEVLVSLKTTFVFLAKAVLIEGKLVLQAISDCSGPLIFNQCKLCLL